jgi:hypothetical protein
MAARRPVTSLAPSRFVPSGGAATTIGHGVSSRH